MSEVKEVRPVTLQDLLDGRSETIEFCGHSITFRFNANAITPRIHREVESIMSGLSSAGQEGGQAETAIRAAEALKLFVTDTGVTDVGPERIDSLPSALVLTMFVRVCAVMVPNSESEGSQHDTSGTGAS